MSTKRRNTKTKQLVFNVLEEASSALCHDDIEQKLTEKIDRVTIYRILNGFCEEGKLHKIVADNGKTYFALCNHCSEYEHNDNHLHFKCLDCGKVTCINTPVKAPKLPAGYAVSSLSLTVSGLCPECLETLNIRKI
jgi:Fe2+ or Zn2+ uptake regulation protein